MNDPAIVAIALDQLAAELRGKIHHHEWERNRWHEMAELDATDEGMRQRTHEHAEVYTVLIDQDLQQLDRVLAARYEIALEVAQ